MLELFLAKIEAQRWQNPAVKALVIALAQTSYLIAINKKDNQAWSSALLNIARLHPESHQPIVALLENPKSQPAATPARFAPAAWVAAVDGTKGVTPPCEFCPDAAPAPAPAQPAEAQRAASPKAAKLIEAGADEATLPADLTAHAAPEPEKFVNGLDGAEDAEEVLQVLGYARGGKGSQPYDKVRDALRFHIQQVGGALNSKVNTVEALAAEYIRARDARRAAQG